MRFLPAICLVALSSVFADEDYIVSIDQGKLRGREEKDVDGNRFVSFQGIPYAKPPEGKLRFKDPQEPEKWGEEVFNATREGEVCFSLQLGITFTGFGMKTSGSENCLVLNVFTRQINSQQQLKPVMVFIHGGAFVTGSSKRLITGPEFLMIEDVVLVTFNYRLGAFGFLNFKDLSLEASGNAALKDMVQALKWVQKNIKKFGGDPGKVTIFGESAGAASVEYLLISPLAKGLFHRAIMQSGSALNPWARGKNGPLALAKALNYTGSDDEKEILDFLQNSEAVNILEAATHMEPALGVAEMRPFGPAVEVDSEKAFLPEEPEKILTSGDYIKVPMIIGYNSLEGLLIEGFKMLGFEINTQDIVPYTLAFEKYDTKYNETALKLIQYYFGDDIAYADNKDAIYKVSGDLTLVRGLLDSVRIRMKTSSVPIFVYRMSVESGLNVFKILAGINHEGVAHGDDLGYLFKVVGTSRGAPGSLEDVSFRRFVRMWANFARSGDPTPGDDPILGVKWQGNVGQGEIAYLDIGKELVLKSDPDGQTMRFLDTVFGSPVARK